MSNISDLVITSPMSNKVYLGWSIILTKLVEAVVEILFFIPVLLRIESLMLSRIFVAPVVPHPNIIASLSSPEGW